MREKEIAETMLARYSSPKVALEMAQLHVHGSGEPDHWRRVASEIRRIARLDAAGNPVKWGA